MGYEENLLAPGQDIGDVYGATEYAHHDPSGGRAAAGSGGLAISAEVSLNYAPISEYDFNNGKAPCDQDHGFGD